MPTDRPRPAMQTYHGDLEFCTAEAELASRREQVARRHGMTMHMLLVDAYQILLHRNTGQDDILVGTPTAGRARAEFSQVVSYFVNPVVLRARLDGDPTLAEFLAQVRRTVLGAFEHQDYPLPLLVEKLQPQRDPSRSPLVQTMFVMQKAQMLHDQGLTPFLMGESGARIELAGLDMESMTLEQWVAQFDLSLAASQHADGLSLAMQFNTDLFDRTTIRRLMQHYRTLLECIAEDPAVRVSELNLLPDAERRQLVGSWARRKRFTHCASRAGWFTIVSSNRRRERPIARHSSAAIKR